MRMELHSFFPNMSSSKVLKELVMKWKFLNWLLKQCRKHMEIFAISGQNSFFVNPPESPGRKVLSQSCCSVPRLNGSCRLQAALCAREVMYHGPAPEEGPVCYHHRNHSTVICPFPSPHRCGCSKSWISHATLNTWAHASSCCLFCFPAIITLLSFCWSLYPGADSLSACDSVSGLLMHSLFGLWRSFHSTREKEKGEKKKVRK